SNALVSSDMGPQADHREKKDWGVCPDIDSLFCAPLISSVDDDWINNNHYLLPGVHVGHSNGKWVRGFEVSYFKSILVGGFGFVFTVDEISYKERFGLGFEAFFTYFGLDINAKSDTFGSLNDFNLQIRPMLSIGWISAYYALGDNHQYGLIFKLPVKLNK
ncbi:MAG: hypothetical protein NT027_06590, partial [Proteobacteria bacterium]|nr:hypothetical protein [Pseudomonadota bacterium]